MNWREEFRELDVRWRNVQRTDGDGDSSVLEPQVIHTGEAVWHIRHVKHRDVPPSLGNHGLRHIDANDLAGGANGMYRQDALQTGPSTEFQDFLTGSQRHYVKWIADATKRLGDGTRQTANLVAVMLRD